MKTLLISYTTLVAFLVMSVGAAVLLPGSNPTVNAATSNSASCFEWVFDYMNTGSVTQNLGGPAVGSLNATSVGVTYRNNLSDYPSNPFNIVDVKIIDPSSNGVTNGNPAGNTPDLNIARGNKVMILDGGRHTDKYTGHSYFAAGTIRDAHNGGDLIFDFNGSNVTQVKFRTIDMGDERGVYNGQQRINNNYYVVTTADGKTEKVSMNTHDGQNLPDKFVWDHQTRDYGKNIKSIKVHFSGSAGLDNLSICNLPKPTSTPPAIPTNVPTATPTALPTATPTPAVKECIQTKTAVFFNNEMLVAGETRNQSRAIGIEENKIPKGVELVNETNYRIDLNDKSVFTGDNNNLRFKYDLGIDPQWGWRGEPNAVRQTNESHNITINADKKYEMSCLDWGNARGKTDGKGQLRSVESSNPIENSRFFRRCIVDFRGRQDNIPVLLRGGMQSVRPDSKGIVNVTAEHTTSNSEFEACKAKNGNAACRGSHYSLVKVHYCVAEGVK